MKWLYDSEIKQFYGDPRFPNAIAYPEPCPVCPDRIVVIATDGDNIMGMAGCSEDAPHWQQVGIDVLPEYRSRGIGTYLVTLLKNKIIEMAHARFYDEEIRKQISKCHYRKYTISEIINSIIGNGFTLERFDEHPSWENEKLPGEFTAIARKN